MRDEFDEIFKDVDVVICPTCPQPPRRHIPADAGPLAWAEHARKSSPLDSFATYQGCSELTYTSWHSILHRRGESNWTPSNDYSDRICSADG
jgi:hypothetical protein